MNGMYIVVGCIGFVLGVLAALALVSWEVWQANKEDR